MNYLLLCGLVFVCILVTRAAPPNEFEDDSKSDTSHEHHAGCHHKHQHDRPHNHRHHPHSLPHHRHPHHRHKGHHHHGRWHKHANHTVDSSEEHRGTGVVEATTISSIATVRVPNLPPAVFTNSNNGADNSGPTALPDYNRTYEDVDGIHKIPDFTADAVVGGVSYSPSAAADQLGAPGLPDFSADVSGFNLSSASSAPSELPNLNVNSVYDGAGMLPWRWHVQQIIPATTTPAIFDIRADGGAENLGPAVINPFLAKAQKEIHIRIRLGHVDPE